MPTRHPLQATVADSDGINIEHLAAVLSAAYGCDVWIGDGFAAPLNTIVLERETKRMG